MTALNHKKVKQFRCMLVRMVDNAKLCVVDVWAIMLEHCWFNKKMLPEVICFVVAGERRYFMMRSLTHHIFLLPASSVNRYSKTQWCGGYVVWAIMFEHCWFNKMLPDVICFCCWWKEVLYDAFPYTPPFFYCRLSSVNRYSKTQWCGGWMYEL